MGSRQEQRHKLKLQLITEAAAEVFSERGIHAATLDQIGEKVGLSKASLYYYVKSKEQLVAEVLRSVLDAIDARTEEKTDPSASALEQLRVRAYSHVLASIDTPAGILIASNLDQLSNHNDTARMMRQHEELARKLLQQAIDQGEIPARPIVPAIKLLYGGLNNVARWYNADYGTIDDVLDQIWAIFVQGVTGKT